MRSANQDTTLVLDDFGENFGPRQTRTAEADTNHETLIRDLLDDQYTRPRRIITFNAAGPFEGLQ